MIYIYPRKSRYHIPPYFVPNSQPVPAASVTSHHHAIPTSEQILTQITTAFFAVASTGHPCPTAGMSTIMSSFQSSCKLPNNPRIRQLNCDVFHSRDSSPSHFQKPGFLPLRTLTVFPARGTEVTKLHPTEASHMITPVCQFHHSVTAGTWLPSLFGGQLAKLDCFDTLGTVLGSMSRTVTGKTNAYTAFMAFESLRFQSGDFC